MEMSMMEIKVMVTQEAVISAHRPFFTAISRNFLPSKNI